MACRDRDLVLAYVTLTLGGSIHMWEVACICERLLQGSYRQTSATYRNKRTSRTAFLNGSACPSAFFLLPASHSPPTSFSLHEVCQAEQTRPNAGQQARARHPPTQGPPRGAMYDRQRAKNRQRRSSGDGTTLRRSPHEGTIDRRFMGVNFQETRNMGHIYSAMGLRGRRGG
jgi:hypothetical protein